MSTASGQATAHHAPTLATLARVFGEGAFPTSRFRDNLRLYVPPERLLDVLGALRDQCGFGMLAELGGADYLGYPGPVRARFEVHYVLLNLETAERLVVKAGVDEPHPTPPPAVPPWPGGNWMESEVFEMYGTPLPGHPDLRRVLLPQ